MISYTASTIFTSFYLPFENTARECRHPMLPHSLLKLIFHRLLPQIRERLFPLKQRHFIHDQNSRIVYYNTNTQNLCKFIWPN